MNFNEFCKSFKMALDAANYSEEAFLEIYKSNRRYTDLIKNLMKVQVTYDINEQYFPEYFTIDHSWWRVEHEKPLNGVNLYDWNMDIAVEHENDCTDWTYEVAKLDSVIARLRVVIGYMDKSKREEELEIVEAQRKNLKNLSFLPKDYEFGVILMNTTLDTDKEDPFDMRCYLLTSGETKRVI